MRKHNHIYTFTRTALQSTLYIFEKIKGFHLRFMVWKIRYKTDRQTMLVRFTWPTKRPGGHQSQL